MILALILLAGCQTYSGKDIAKSIEKISTEETQQYIPLPSNRRINQEKNRSNEALSTYSNQFGYYLNQFGKQVEEMSDFFYEHKPNEASLKKTKQHLETLTTLSDEISSHKVPKEFSGLSTIHTSMLRELNYLKSSIKEVELDDEQSFQRAKYHFENTVISLGLVEREYLMIHTNYGLK